jgi:hypothetical protein
MIDFLARFSPRLRAMLTLLREVEHLLVAANDVLHDKGSDPKVQVVLNEIHDVRRKFDAIRGG